MVKRIVWSTALVAALCAFLSVSALAQKPKVFNGKLQAGAPAVGTEEPCILNPCLLYAGDFDNNGPNPNGLWNGNNTTFGITGTAKEEGRGGEIVLARQQIERALLGIEAIEGGVPQIAIGEVVMQVAQEDRRTALHVVP